MEMIECILRR